MTRRWVLLLVFVGLVVVGGVAALVAFAGVSGLRELFQPGRAAPPFVTVEAVYPGANAQVLADTVAAPIEQQLVGVENMRYMTSRCDNDGRYTLRVFFEPRTDMAMAQVLVQNRVTLALPVMPDLVQRQGINIRKDAAHPLLFVVLLSPDNSYDSLYLANYARIQLVDELGRVSGVSRVTLVGERQEGWRLWLDPQRLAARDLGVVDVIRALEEQNVRVVAAGGNAVLNVHGLDRLPAAADVEEIIVKTAAPGQIVRVKDIGRVEIGVDAGQSEARLDGKSVALLAIYPLPDADPRTVRADVASKLDLLRAHLPPRLDLRMPFDFSTRDSEYLTIDVDLPAAASAQRTSEVARKCDALLRNEAGVAHVLSLCGPPFRDLPSAACLLVELQPRSERAKGRSELAAAVRAQLLKEIPEAATRIRSPDNAPRLPLADYPLCLALSADDLETVRPRATTLRELLATSPALTDVHGPPSDVPQVQLDIDRTQATALGVSMQDIMTTMQATVGSFYVNDFDRFGRRWQIQLQMDSKNRVEIEGLKQLKIRNNLGQMVPLGAIVTVREVSQAAIVERVNGRPALVIRANPAAGESIERARKAIEAYAAQVAPDCQLTWLGTK
jgi:multidrug efflux pump subunit AcrB